MLSMEIQVTNLARARISRDLCTITVQILAGRRTD